MSELHTFLRPENFDGRVPAGFEGPVEPWSAASEKLLALGFETSTETRAFFVPGRIEVLGKHTDYAGGRSITAAIAQGLYLLVVERTDAQLRIHDIGRGRTASLDLAGELGHSPGHWTSYPLAVARRMRADFCGRLRGAEIVLTSTLPAAAGLSSSSALVVGFWLALAAVNRPQESPAYESEIESREDLAGYLGSVEAGRPFGRLAADQGVGTFGGSQDHTAILCSRAGFLSQYSYAPVRRERSIELPSKWTFAVAVSGVHAKKTGIAREAYNLASLAAEELAALWRRETGGREHHLGAILATGRNARAELLRLVRNGESERFEREVLNRRLEHFAAESEEIVPAAGSAIAEGRIADFAGQTSRSQDLAERLLANQTPETSLLARTAPELGAVCASAFGAGFGGAVWALVERDRLPELAALWLQRYRERAPERNIASVLSSRPGPAAFELRSTP